MEVKQKELEELKKRDEKSFGKYELPLVNQIYGATVIKDAYVGYYEERRKKIDELIKKKEENRKPFPEFFRQKDAKKELNSRGD